MTDRGITERAPMVRALLDGRKVQTRRLAWRECPCCFGGGRVYAGECGLCGGSGQKPTIWQKVRRGDRLWVRETWCTDRAYDKLPPRDLPSGASINWRAGSGNLWPSTSNLWGKTRQSIHMPRWASRITLEVTATKLEGLQDISEEDAQAEGFSDGRLDDGFGPRPFGDTGLTIESPGTLVSAGGAFQMAWAKLHPDWDGYSSPEVVALTFTVHHQNIDSMEAAA